MPHALIVDDSKTARYALRQLLDRHQFTVDMVESAEEALEYLRTSSPDLIFMDHMMPGMDGFQAVKAIKSNPGTHDIPIVMYTSTQGGVYFGQARALGAADVIAKPATAEDLAGVLNRLQQQAVAAGRTPTPLAATSMPSARTPLAVPAAEPRSATPLHTPAAESVTPEFTPLPEVPPRRGPTPTPVPTGNRGYWLAALLALAVIWLGWSYREASLQGQALAGQRLAALAAVEWALNLEQEYPYGEPPFSGERLRRLQELLVQLQTAGFRGQVRLESHVGEFCLVQARTASSGWRLAPEDLPLTECGALGQSSQRSQQLAEAQSAAFRRFVRESPLLAGSGITLELAARGAREPLVDYPTDASVSAGNWNRVAQRNQRVRVQLLPLP